MAFIAECFRVPSKSCPHQNGFGGERLHNTKPRPLKGA